MWTISLLQSLNTSLTEVKFFLKMQGLGVTDCCRKKVIIIIIVFFLVYSRTTLNTPNLIWSQKLSRVRAWLVLGWEKPIVFFFKSNFSFALVIRGRNCQSKPGITENRSFNWFFSFKGSQSVSIEGKPQASQGQWPVLPLSSLHPLHPKGFLTHHRPQPNKHMQTDSFNVWQYERMNKLMTETRGKHGLILSPRCSNFILILCLTLTGRLFINMSLPLCSPTFSWVSVHNTKRENKQFSKWALYYEQRATLKNIFDKMLMYGRKKNVQISFESVKKSDFPLCSFILPNVSCSY